MMKFKIELTNIEDVKRFNAAVENVDCDVRLVGKDEHGNEWNMSGKSILCSLILTQKEQMDREHTAHDVDWNTIWCICEKDIYSLIQDFVVL